MDITDGIIAYENGDMTDAQLVDFFAELVRTGLAWQLQGHYGRTAQNLIAKGIISRSGEVLVHIGRA